MDANRRVIVLVVSVIMIALIAIFAVVAINGFDRDIQTDYVAIGNASYEQGDYEGAIIAYKKALSEDPRNESAYVGLIRAFHISGQDYLLYNILNQAVMNGLDSESIKQRAGIGEEFYAEKVFLAYSEGGAKNKGTATEVQKSAEPEPVTPPAPTSNDGDASGEVVTICTVQGSIVDATTGVNLGQVNILAHKENRNGHVVKQIDGAWGTYSMQLEEGKYTLEVVSLDKDSSGRPMFENAYVDIEVKEGQTSFVQNIVVSPIINKGEIRIVLTWYDTPSDLDAYLRGSGSKGSDVFINYANRESTSAAGKTAALDVDCRNGYGPETITIYDIGGDYTFSVVDFMGETRGGDTSAFRNCGATVTVYTADGKSRTIKISDASSNAATGDFHWVVCRIKNGEVTSINAIEDTSFTPGYK